MAVIKHISSKNANYGAAELYLEYQHDEQTSRPILDEYGHYIPREEYLISGIHCTPDTFAVECIKANLQYCQNQKQGDVKSHHYIISFDPRDQADHGLTLEEVQKIGEQFCRESFTGHQALVCSHADGHHKTGNLHVHIVINSLRIEDIPRQSYMDSPCDSRAGAKHRCTGKLMRHLRQRVMELCMERGLYQVDLLSGAAKKVTDKEYHAQQSGQKKLDKHNAQLIAEGKQPTETIFDTQKEELRQAIDATWRQCSTLDEFAQKLFQDYGIEVTESRGRFSYLHPNAKRKVADRRLGESYRKGYIANGISEQNHRREFSERSGEADEAFLLSDSDLTAAAQKLTQRREKANSQLADDFSTEPSGIGEQPAERSTGRDDPTDDRTGGKAESLLSANRPDPERPQSLRDRLRAAGQAVGNQQRPAQPKPQHQHKRSHEPSL